jgi:ubiquinone/menaquinone biosynthesis C-methylase UbiE
MGNTPASVERHYGRGEILNSILRALTEAGKDVSKLTPVDLAPVDEFHIRGREATIELAARASLKPALRVLDVGSGLGGSARYLASEHRCQVTGIDLTREYVETARALADRVGLGGQIEFRQCGALAMPVENGSFDVVWTEHVQMNIADKRAFYGEIARVLRFGGQLAFHDIFQGVGGEPHFPVPWAEERSISFLATPEAIRETLGQAGLRIVDWEDRSEKSLQWFTEAVEKVKQSGPPPMGIHLLMGATARTKLENIVRNLHENRVVVYQAIAEKSEEHMARLPGVPE